MNEGEEKRDEEGKGGEERRESDVWSVGLGLRNDACTSTVQVRDGGRGLWASCESRDGAGSGGGGGGGRGRVRATEG